MTYILSLLRNLGIEDEVSHVYAHSSFTNQKALEYMHGKNFNTELIKTGVKYANPILKKYDIGVHSEPCGHGRLTYKLDKIMKVLSKHGLKEDKDAKKLIWLLQVSNHACGDAIANFLLIESILYDLDMSVEQFDQIYTENPFVNTRINADDLSMYKVSSVNETKLMRPKEL